ncbi:MAG: hypothetical protein NVSMB12_03410 [Acidimicrobiales bacterium]
MPDAHKSPLDQALDLLVFAPMGLALTAKDELPQLVEKGRTRVGNQLMLAKMIGQFAVAQGQKEAGKLVEQAGSVASRLGGLPGVPGPGAHAAAPTAGATGATASAASVTPSVTPPTSPSAAANVPSANGTSVNGATPARSTGSADGLAIPGYDTLSASQVVQRLGGLSSAELEAVRRYEEGTRSRRTILSKVSQLEAERR